MQEGAAVLARAVQARAWLAEALTHQRDTVRLAKAAQRRCRDVVQAEAARLSELERRCAELGIRFTQ